MLQKLVFVLGGARSGKSTYALENASLIEGRKAFVATAQAFDDEMRLRIENHRRERGPDWTTFEEPLGIAPLIEDIKSSHKAILIDCLTLWASNIMHAEFAFTKEVDHLIEALCNYRPAPIYVVSNEVGLGLVPENELARTYRDNLGFLNRKVAQAATNVYFMVAGMPVTIKETCK